MRATLTPTLTRILAAVAAMAITSGCQDPCFLVAGCQGAEHIAVDGRILTAETGHPAPGARLTLVGRNGASAESTQAVSDSRGLFFLSMPSTSDTAVKFSLHVEPPNEPGYTISALDCRPTDKGGDGCVLAPITAEPTFPIYQFRFRKDVDRIVTNAPVTFRRTGGPALFGPNATDSLVTATDAEGYVMLYPPGIWAAGLDPVIGDLTVVLPPPYGPTVRHNFSIHPVYQFNMRPVGVEAVGPTLEYILVFSDSATLHRVAGVTVDCVRVGGIATKSESASTMSNSDGLAFVDLGPLTHGTVTADFTITPPGATVTTKLNGLSMTTFDADSSIVLGRWKIGATGILYPTPPGGP
jgi:hypothetical protein